MIDENDELCRYLISIYDKISIGKNIYIHYYHLSELKSTNADSLFIQYELNNDGIIVNYNIDYDIVLKHKKNYKTKIRLHKLKKLLK